MQIVIPTIGSRGDVQPYIALAQGLGRAGHSATLASHPGMRELVESHGVVFAPVGPDVDMSREAGAIRARSKNSMVALVRVMRFAFDVLQQAHEDILAQCQGADLVVVAASSAAGKNEADLLELPNASVNFMPWSITVHDPQRPLYKRFAYAAFDKLVELMTIQPFNRLRRKQGLGPVGPEGMSSARLDLVPISPAVYAPNPLWHPRHRVVGYWFVQEPGGWEPAADLLAFMENGEPPLLVSLGAMSLGDGDALGTASLFVEALQQTGARAVVQGWEGAMAQLDLPASIYAAGPLPHSWLLPRVAGVVHHGGFGTTSACLRAGAPQQVVPHIADQFFWGQRVRELGVGPAYIRRPNLKVQGLAAALDELLHNGDLSAAAAPLGEQIRAEDGVAEAVRLIEETFS